MSTLSIRLTASAAILLSGIDLHADEKQWTLDSQEEWQKNINQRDGVEIKDGTVSSPEKTVTLQSAMKSFPEKRSAHSITITQSPIWQNWEPAGNIGPRHMGGAPIFLRKGDKDYWAFGKASKNQKVKTNSKDVTLDGFDIPLKASNTLNQFFAPGGLKGNKGGYHGWQSRDMVNWVYHGPVTPERAGWATTAELVDGKAYIYYDYPNDQDPHLVIDADLTDGVPGKDMGMAFEDPSHGSDSVIIRDLEGKFHLILEDWSPIDASTHAWDSPLAMHAVSNDGIKDFKILPPAVDERTKPTGQFAEFFHPHWHLGEHKNKFPNKPVPKNIPQHRMKKGQIRGFAKYEIHEPEQNAYGDWAAISIDNQYYLFCDFDPVGGHGKKAMSVGWFTSSSINEKFTFCDNIGQGHPDPDIMFAAGKFHLITQTPKDFVSPGPWVDGVEVRVGVDTNKDGKINQWTEWQNVKESYHGVPGFAKQVAKTPAQMDLSKLPDGFGFQFEVRLTDTTKNKSKPILDKVMVTFE